MESRADPPPIILSDSPRLRGQEVPRKSQNHVLGTMEAEMEPRRPFDPLRPTPIEPIPSPLRPSGQYVPRNDENVRILKEILDRLTGIENRLKAVEEALKTRR
jgi:hypothetical protein